MTVPAVVTLTNGTSAWANQVATDVNGLLASVASLSTLAGVPRYATTAARDTAIPIPAQGNLVYVIAGDDYWYYNGAAWANLTDHPDLISRYGLKSLGFVTPQLTDASDHVTSAAIELTVLTATPTLVAGRRYMLTARMHTGLTVATDQFFVRGYIAADVPLLAFAPSVSANQVTTFTSQASAPVAGGATTVKLTVQRSAGTGTCSVSGSSFSSTLLSLFDVGT